MISLLTSIKLIFLHENVSGSYLLCLWTFWLFDDWIIYEYRTEEY